MTAKTRRNLAILRTNPQFADTERAMRAQHPALSEYEAALAALSWLALLEDEGLEVLETTNPGLTQVQ